MGISDILLEDDRIGVLGDLDVSDVDGGTTRAFVDGTSGAVELGAAGIGNEDVSIRPNWATLNLGGGGGDHSDGDVKLFDEDGDVRVHASGGGGDEFGETTRAFVDGTSGDVELGAAGVENEDVSIRPNWATLNLGGGGGDHSDGDLKLHEESGEPRIHLSAGGGGEFDATRVFAKGDRASLRLGNEQDDREGGELAVKHQDGSDGVVISNNAIMVGEPLKEGYFPNWPIAIAGARHRLWLSDDEYSTTVALDGAEGAIELLADDGELVLDGDESDISLGPVGSLVDTIDDLQQRVSELEQRVADLESGGS